jgi:hypothetical protein
MFRKTLVLVALLVFACSSGFAQGPAKLRDEQPSMPVDEIIRRFADKEKEFKEARAQYVYQQDIQVQSLNANDRVTGEWRQLWEVGFDSRGRRIEKVLKAPMDTLKDFSMSPQDLQDLREIQPFVLTSDDIVKYDVKYLGKELIDEIDCFVFEVIPKKIEKDQRYFQGHIWVDDKDLQIVKTYGKAVPDLKGNVFPRFETYREQIDGKYWFPTYTRALDTLRFDTYSARIREVIKYDKYKKFEADVKLTFGDAVDAGGTTDKPAAPDDKRAPALDPKYKQPPTKQK